MPENHIMNEMLDALLRIERNLIDLGNTLCDIKGALDES